MKEIKMQTKEEFVRTQNGMKIHTITLPSKSINNQSKKHLVYFIGGNRALSPRFCEQNFSVRRK